MAKDLAAGKTYTERIGEYLGDQFVRAYDFLCPRRTSISVSQDREEVEFERSCVGKPKILRPLYRIADSVGVSSPKSRINELVEDAEQNIESLGRRIMFRQEELEDLRERYSGQEAELVSKKADAKSAIKQGDSQAAENSTGIDENDKLLDLAASYAEYAKTEKRIGEYEGTISWLKTEKEKQMEKLDSLRQFCREEDDQSQ